MFKEVMVNLWIYLIFKSKMKMQTPMMILKEKFKNQVIINTKVPKEAINTVILNAVIKVVRLTMANFNLKMMRKRKIIKSLK